MQLNDWKTYNIDTVYEVKSGLSKKRDQFGFGYSFLSFKEVFNNYFLPDELSELVNSTKQEREKASILRGDVFLTRTSETQHELGMSSVALKDYPNATFNGFTKRLRPKGNVDILPEYAGYYFRSLKFRNKVSSLSILTTRASLNNSMLSTLTIDLPPIQKQKSIANILSSLDNKIDNNKAIIANLEEQAHSIFKSWFVNFEPFQDEEFVDSEIGRIPCTFETIRLENLFRLRSGFAFKSNDWSTIGRPIIKIKDIMPPTINHKSVDYVKDSVVLEKANDFKVHGGEIIIALTGATTGKFGLVPYNHISYVNQRAGLFFDMTSSGYGFLYGLLNQDFFLNRIIELAQGSAQANLSPKDVNNLLVPYEKNAFNRINSVLNPIIKYSSYLLNENTLLERTRDTLLPKLMSGKIQVDEAIEMK